jgi:hypothetical protein
VTQQELKDAVYGDLYKSAQQQMSIIQQAITQQMSKGFESQEACESWAKEHQLDLIALGKAQKKFFYISHYGEILTKDAWADYYCKDILFWWDVTDKGKSKPVPWIPSGFKYINKARVNGEVGDGIRQPLSHRNYFTPTGYYDLSTNTFNVASPFPVFAKETGADTSHIYTYINHLAGECAPYLLAWLRHKMLYPTLKTEVVPVIVSRYEGTGKTTFAETLCKGLFGKDNVVISESYDAAARFNSDAADRLIICIEEKEETERRNAAATIKSRSTATTVRKEHKGIDPIYQEDYTDYIMTTNKDVPIKFDDRTDHRRFMLMEPDPTFTRKTSELADEVFTKLYGKDAIRRVQGIPFAEDVNTIAQFKHELYTNEELASLDIHKFPKTPAYERCFSLPRTSEAVEIESILRSLMPFIKETLVHGTYVTQLELDDEKILKLSSIIQVPGAMQYMPATRTVKAMVALCRPLIFYDMSTGKPFQHATVERGIYDAETWLLLEYGIRVIRDMGPLEGGFIGVAGRFRSAPAARFALAIDETKPKIIDPVTRSYVPPERIGERLRVNNKWQPDPLGEYETLNEMKPGTVSLKNKSNNVQYMDTFLFEADDVPKHIAIIEQARSGVAEAEGYFKERLAVQRSEAERLFKAGIAARVVYSGGKSYHILVRVKDSPSTLDERKWLHAYLSTVLSDKLIFDPVNYDPARLTRAPMTKPRMFEYNNRLLTGVQELVHENWNNIHDISWRQLYNEWLNRPLAVYETNRRLVPTKPEYKDAMEALLKGTFWTDPIWHGRRQQCFFPGYRLCRYLGYTHEQLWSETGILENLNNYYRSSEINYWKNRESCDLVKQIDADIDAMEEELE